MSLSDEIERHLELLDGAPKSVFRLQVRLIVEEETRKARRRGVVYGIFLMALARFVVDITWVMFRG